MPYRRIEQACEECDHVYQVHETDKLGCRKVDSTVKGFCLECKLSEGKANEEPHT